MSSPLPTKRRKLNDATKTLSKPFVSPMRSKKPPPDTPLRDSTNLANRPYNPSTLAHTIKTSYPPLPAHATPNLKPPTLKRSTLTPTTKRSTPAAELTAQKALTNLELRIRALRTDIDTLTQPSRHSSDSDAALEQLSAKWRLASQQAAEELFGSVKERVCRMGGVSAWRESERRKREPMSWGQEEVGEGEGEGGCEFDSQGEELPEEEVEFRRGEVRRVRREAREAMEDEGGGEVEREGRGKEVWEEEGGGNDDDAFTMDMMLRSLNIELKVIGYDKEGQRWVQ